MFFTLKRYIGLDHDEKVRIPMKKENIVLIGALLIIIATWVLMKTDLADSIHITYNGQQISNPIIGVFGGIFGFIISVIVLFCVGILLIFIFSGIGVILIGVFGVVGVVLTIVAFPFLLPLLIPLLLLFLIISAISH